MSKFIVTYRYTSTQGNGGTKVYGAVVNAETTTEAEAKIKAKHRGSEVSFSSVEKK